MKTWIIFGALLALASSKSIEDNDKNLFQNGHQIFAWENGMVVHEVIATDLKDGLVMIKMPKHNGLDAMHIMTDFKNGWTMRKFVDKKQCHLTGLDRSQFDPPEVLEETFEKLPLEKYLWQNVPNITNSYIIEDELDDLSFLNCPKMVSFCGGWPVYLTKLVDKRPGIAESYGHGIQIFPASLLPKRQKRQDFIIDDCPDNKRKSACILTNRYCHYITTCNREKDKQTNFDESKCEKNHEYGEARCCTSCCSSEEQSSEFSPFCGKLKVCDFKCYDKSVGKFIKC